MKQLAMGVATVILLSFGVGACGDEDGSSPEAAGPTVTTSALTKAQFERQATQICHQEHADLLARFSKYLEGHESRSKSNGEEIAAAVHEVWLPTIEREVRKIQALGAPSGDEEQVSAFLGMELKGVEEVAKLKSIRSIPQVEAYFDEATKLASDYGIPDCGNGSPPAG